MEFGDKQQNTRKERQETRNMEIQVEGKTRNMDRQIDRNVDRMLNKEQGVDVKQETWKGC
jgi:hypothetical protein